MSKKKNATWSTTGTNAIDHRERGISIVKLPLLVLGRRSSYPK